MERMILERIKNGPSKADGQYPGWYQVGDFLTATHHKELKDQYIQGCIYTHLYKHGEWESFRRAVRSLIRKGFLLRRPGKALCFRKTSP
jgi:hypothetical protein